MHSYTPIASCTTLTEQYSFCSGLFELLELGTHLHFLVYNEHLAAQESDDLIYVCYISIG